MLFWIVVLLLIAAFFFFTNYNKLQRACQPVRESFSNIQVMIRKKIELTRQLMDVCKGNADHEKMLQFKVSTDAADSIKAMAAANGRAEQAIVYMSQLAGQIPALKTDVNYRQLSDKLEKIGDELQRKREQYNSHAAAFNTIRNQVPTIFVAQLVKSFSQAPFLDFGDEASLDLMQTFQTDDGERLGHFLGDLGNKVVGVGTAVTQKARIGGAFAVEFGRERLGLTKYHYSEGGAAKGPVTRKELDVLIESKKLSAQVFILEEGTKDWFKYEVLIAKDAPPPPPDSAVPPPPDSTKLVGG